MEHKFDAIVIVPLSLLVGMAVGIGVVTGNVPTQLISQGVSVLLATFIAIVVLELLIRTISNAVLSVLFNEPEEIPNEGAPGELTILLVRDGEVVSQVNSWDKPMPKPKRLFWSKKLGRLLSRHKIVKKPETL